MAVNGVKEPLDPDEMVLLGLALLRLGNDPTADKILQERLEVVARKLGVDTVISAILDEMPKS